MNGAALSCSKGLDRGRMIDRRSAENTALLSWFSRRHGPRFASAGF